MILQGNHEANMIFTEANMNMTYYVYLLNYRKSSPKAESPRAASRSKRSSAGVGHRRFMV